MPGAVVVDVVSDVVCPWCYIGKRRLEAAIAQLRASNPDLPFEVRWHPFQLNPDLPAEGVDRQAYLEAKFGGPGRTKQVYERVMAAGRSVGIPFDLDAIKRQPNTLAAHRLVAWAQSRTEGDADALVEGLFRANFVEGRFVGSVDELAGIATAAGYDPDRRTRVSRIRRVEGRGRAVGSSRARDGHRRRAVLHLRRQDRVVGRAGARGHRAGDRTGARRRLIIRRHQG